MENGPCRLALMHSGPTDDCASDELPVQTEALGASSDLQVSEDHPQRASLGRVQHHDVAVPQLPALALSQGLGVPQRLLVGAFADAYRAKGAEVPHRDARTPRLLLLPPRRARALGEWLEYHVVAGERLEGFLTEQLLPEDRGVPSAQYQRRKRAARAGRAAVVVDGRPMHDAALRGGNVLEEAAAPQLEREAGPNAVAGLGDAGAASGGLLRERRLPLKHLLGLLRQRLLRHLLPR
mmetsp:Transcript_88210/g.252794  ORF Transcript_88210/g.252794 Transcript_88210/m.252794 type:complete len:237 (+) Transcript_88210:96-806(+)